MCVVSAFGTKCGVSLHFAPSPAKSNLRSECFDVSQLKPVCFQANAWDQLVLDEEYKDVLETVVSSHVDKVAGLRGSAGGKGLSILLNGGPGVGKTLTVGAYFIAPPGTVNC